MSKKQKIWLGIFLAMFIIPELLWSPVLGLLPFGKIFVSNSDNHQTLTIIVLLEFLGLLFSVITLGSSKNKTFLVWFGMVFTTIIALWSFYIFYLLLATLNFWQ